ncbi:MAG: alpha/beta fold hydrolase, partial [Candidatus Roizmanbacteria bacterium]
ELSKTYHILSHIGEMSKKSPARLRPLFFFWNNRFLIFFLSLIFLQFHKIGTKIRFGAKHFLSKKNENQTVLQENLLSLYEYHWKRLSYLTCAVHLIHGDHDMIVNVKNIYLMKEKYIPHASLDVIEGSGHIPTSETPQSLIRILKRFE